MKSNFLYPNFKMKLKSNQLAAALEAAQLTNCSERGEYVPQRGLVPEPRLELRIQQSKCCVIPFHHSGV